MRPSERIIISLYSVYVPVSAFLDPITLRCPIRFLAPKEISEFDTVQADHNGGENPELAAVRVQSGVQTGE